MSEKVQLNPAKSTSAVSKFAVFEIPRRDQVLASLQPGEKVNVEILENFAGGKALLKVKGASITANAAAQWPVGTKMQAIVEKTGGAFILRRAESEDLPEQAALARLVKTRMEAMDERSQAVANLLTNKAMATLAGSRGGLAGLIARLNGMLGELFNADGTLNNKLADLASLLGLAPLGAGDRIREMLGRNLPGVLERLLAGDKAEWLNLLAANPALSAEEMEKLSSQVGKLKEQIGFLRALNALFESKDLPLFLSIPFLFQGVPQPTELWIYKHRDKREEQEDPETTSVLIRLQLSRLGEIRAWVVAKGAAVNVSIYTENETVAQMVNESLPELQQGLELAGLKPQLAVTAQLNLAPLPDPRQLLYGTRDTQALDIKV